PFSPYVHAVPPSPVTWFVSSYPNARVTPSIVWDVTRSASSSAYVSKVIVAPDPSVRWELVIRPRASYPYAVAPASAHADPALPNRSNSLRSPLELYCHVAFTGVAPVPPTSRSVRRFSPSNVEVVTPPLLSVTVVRFPSGSYPNVSVTPTGVSTVRAR